MKTRKELKKEYLRTPKEMGVYRIRNTLNNRSYIAASIDIKARFNRHRMSLKTNNESVKALHTEWLKYGEDAFEFEILDRLTPLEKPDYDPTEDLKTLEALWLEKLQPYEPTGYHPAKKTE
ncbi:MAG: GIY-YIG nuclease family protein [Gammaproteobacteria bacterium]|nr:GIY-YIG nuclease family protein [Gammaproteobacteria bacterium]MBT3870816.1 GIY-YIG nuclease family protein [Gammaproteobacteria bacterium]MBT4380244.1 GIY-YIG nuclease family protein [Gammaproteobacteria bacterium]MBT4615207.1 GIY-YIG nuclease family protein [Gammaproteobacteria bacterium]MBT5197773.1 GIY-YIG nuclease family protein [Gammaproteobacteria bacterium]